MPYSAAKSDFFLAASGTSKDEDLSFGALYGGPKPLLENVFNLETTLTAAGESSSHSEFLQGASSASKSGTSTDNQLVVDRRRLITVEVEYQVFNQRMDDMMSSRPRP